MTNKLSKDHHTVLRRILYRASESYVFIEPGTDAAQGVSFPHLDDAEIMLLRKKGIIAPEDEKPAVTKKEAK